MRREAVARRLAGESPEAIARSLGRTRQWVARWVRRYDPADPQWAKERSRAPRRVANRTSERLEAQIVAVRHRLQEDPWAQVGAANVCWQLENLGIAAPSTRTVERILARAGLAPRPRTGRREPKGVPYPAPPSELPGDLQQADLVGPRHLDGGLPFVALNAIDVAAHAAGIEIAPEQSEPTITDALHAIWGRLGLPRRLQLDNGKPFVLGATRLGEIVRVCLQQGVTPVFIPQGSRGETRSSSTSTIPSTSASTAPSASYRANSSPAERLSSSASTTPTIATAPAVAAPLTRSPPRTPSAVRRRRARSQRTGPRRAGSSSSASSAPTASCACCAARSPCPKRSSTAT